MKLCFSKIALFISFATLMLTGCAVVDSMTGKTTLEVERNSLEQQLANLKNEQKRLNTANTDLEKQLGQERDKTKSLSDEKAAVLVQIENCKTGQAQISESKALLEKQMAQESESCKNREMDYQDKIKKLEQSSAKGISVVFFSGDIIYEVMLDAYKNYRAGLRYKALSDTVFGPMYSQFEEGKGGDAGVLAILKEIDSSGDRVIDAKEAIRFRQSAEESYSRKNVSSGD
ncbi:MAG: hypothetical protein HZA78_12325 [Candidatus Schekmanbacteria bacterium]|nr:hypothetical protein [Candidatus Schekmanbacteria bacterium]